MTSILSYLNGISAIVAVSMAYLFGTLFIIKYLRQRKKLMPYTAIIGFSLGSFHMGTIVSFISLLVTGLNIDFVLGGYLGMSSVPIGIIDTMYLGFTIFKPELKTKVLILFIMTAIVYYIAIIFIPSDVFSGTIPPQIIPGENELVDFAVRGIVLYLIIFYIASVILIVVVGFYKLSKRITGEEQKKARWISIAFILYAISAILDVTAPVVIIVIPRAIMILSYYYLYKGFM